MSLFETTFGEGAFQIRSLKSKMSSSVDDVPDIIINQSTDYSNNLL